MRRMPNSLVVILNEVKDLTIGRRIKFLSDYSLTLMRLSGMLLLTSLLLAPAFSQAASPRSSTSKGVDHYNNEEYDKALAEFLAGLEKAPDRTELNYDLGAALYRLQQYPQAAEAFKKAAAKKDSKLSSDAWFNLGNTLFNAEKFDDAAKAYKNSLILDSKDKDAKKNLELALRMKQMQQKQQQQKQQDGEKGQDKQEQQQQQNQQQKGEEQKKEEEQQQAQAQQDSSQAKQDSTEQQMPEQNGPMSREEALQLLQAMEEDEAEAQKQKLIRQFGEPKPVRKDW